MSSRSGDAPSPLPKALAMASMPALPMLLLSKLRLVMLRFVRRLAAQAAASASLRSQLAMTTVRREWLVANALITALRSSLVAASQAPFPTRV